MVSLRALKPPGDRDEPSGPTGTDRRSTTNRRWHRDLLLRIRFLLPDAACEPAQALHLVRLQLGVNDRALLDLDTDDDLDAVFAQGCASIAELLSGGGADLAVFANTNGSFHELPGPGLSGRLLSYTPAPSTGDK